MDDVGFYTVGKEKFYNKIHAMFRAQQVNLDPVWHFNDEVFTKFDWTVEPIESLDELHKIRAKQIREKRKEFSKEAASTTGTRYFAIDKNYQRYSFWDRETRQNIGNVFNKRITG